MRYYTQIILLNNKYVTIFITLLDLAFLSRTLMISLSSSPSTCYIVILLYSENMLYHEQFIMLDTE